MSRVFPDKYVIGLTGNIATGKSVVRKMLEHLGAYGLDADRLAHRAIAKGAPGYKPVVEMFGRWIVGPDGEIDRRKLGRIVFSDPEALAHLEAIVHPLVEQAIHYLVRNTPHKVVVIEAIKLLESGLHKVCDAVWVVDAPPEVQMERLVKQRGMSVEEARQRIMAQPPQSLKRARADVIIDNSRTYEYTWRQVVDAWMKIPGVTPLQPSRRTVTVPTAEKKTTRPPTKKGRGAKKTKKPAARPKPAKKVKKEKAAPAPQPAAPVTVQVEVERATPRHAQEIADFIAQATRGKVRPERAEIIARFGDRAYLLVRQDGKLVGLVGWQVENLITRINEFYIHTPQGAAQAIQAVMDEVLERSRELQCEAALVFLHPKFYRRTQAQWQRLGFEERSPEDLTVPAWQEAALESRPPGPTIMLFKQLRTQRVLQPL